MAKIKSDLQGIVCAYRSNGDVVQLQAGDEIPADINLGSHLVDSGKETRTATPEPVQGPAPEDDPEEPVTGAPKRRGRPRKTPAVPGGAGD